MEQVAKNLNFEFTHYDLEEKNAALVQDKVIRLLRSEHRPDAIILAALAENTIPLLEAAEQNHVAVVIQRTLTATELSEVGFEARRKYKHWIGSFRQDEVQKGYDSAKALFEYIEHKSHFRGTISLVALSGPLITTTSSLRVDGMRKALKSYPNIELKEVVATDWSPEQGKKAMERLAKLYPDIRAIWATSDQLAISGLEVLEREGRKPGIDVLASGIDISEIGIDRIIKGEMVASSAMSMLGFSEMLIYIYDYLLGVDFAQETGTLIMPRIVTARIESAKEHRELYRRMDKINFRRFSKSYNKDLKTYNMSLNAFFDEVGIHICNASKKQQDLCYRRSSEDSTFSIRE